VFDNLAFLILIPFRVYGDLTPCVPLSSDKERGKVLKRGAGAPLKHPTLLSASKWSLRGTKSLSYNLSFFSLIRGDKGGWGY